MASEKFMILDPAYRKLQKLKELVREENASSKISAEIDEVIDLLKARYDYCEGITSDPSKDLQQLMHSTFHHQWQNDHAEGKLSRVPSTIMMSGKLEAQFLRSLTSLCNAERVLELGLFTGCTALAFAESIPEDGKVVSCELDPYIADLARSFLDKTSCGKKVEIMKGPAKSSLEILAKKKEQFDIIFIDADKKGYITYYKTIWDLGLLAPKGTILVDNVLFHGDPYSKEGRTGEIGQSIINFNEMVRKDDRVHKIMVPIRDGLMIIRRKEDVDRQK
uniref:Caffeoyl-CoA O-methyltransferase n=1 Tax=Magallana gigas TaxID=29159 RepID=A0A8W8I1A8_MAGGI|nr:O-methyltransferase MdmC-like [Crassostrea gigas]